MEIVILLILLLAAALAPICGADSRNGRDWQSRADWEVLEELGRVRADASR